MKRLISLLAACAAFVATTVALEPTGFTFDITISGTASPSDKRAMLLAVANENAARLARSNTNALPTATAADLRASYRAVLLKQVTDAHADNITHSVAAESAEKVATEAVLKDVRAVLIDQINAGVSVSNLVQALKAAK